MIEIIRNNSRIWIGQNDLDNWNIIDNSKPDSIWFHLKSFPSPHVIIQNPEYSKEEISEAANLCKKYSKFKNLKNLKISYCKISNIKKSEKIGSVEFISNRQVSYIKI
tara:strand:+ start:28786 stop:29109 length:324 start_codon:yes stop_codon:yes gene_type:complete